MAKTRGFQSDLSTLLLGANASVTYQLAGSANPVTTSWGAFLADEKLTAFKGLLLSITIPFNTTESKDLTTVYASYKTSIRPENSHALLNCAFTVRLRNAGGASGTHATFSDEKDGLTFAYGGVAYGKPGNVAVRASKTEALLRGQPVNEDTLQVAMKSLAAEFKIEGERADYRQRMVTSLFYKFFVGLLGGKTSVPVASAANPTNAPRQLVVAKQNFTFDEKIHGPVSKPIPKVEGGLQCSGEAVFVDDMPHFKDSSFGALVCTTVARGTYKGYNAKAALSAPGVIGVVDASHIPGENVASVFREGEGRPVLLAAGTKVLHYGQPVAVIVADSKQHAEAAAKLVKVDVEYNKEKDGVPITTLKQAIDQKSLYV